MPDGSGRWRTRLTLQRPSVREWSMAFRVAGAMGAASPTQQDELLSQRLSLSGVLMSLSRGLLAKFWSGGRNFVVPNLIELSVDLGRRTHSGRIASRRTA